MMQAVCPDQNFGTLQSDYLALTWKTTISKFFFWGGGGGRGGKGEVCVWYVNI
jgi:hypothetical protein